MAKDRAQGRLKCSPALPLDVVGDRWSVDLPGVHVDQSQARCRWLGAQKLAMNCADLTQANPRK